MSAAIMQASSLLSQFREVLCPRLHKRDEVPAMSAEHSLAPKHVTLQYALMGASDSSLLRLNPRNSLWCGCIRLIRLYHL